MRNVFKWICESRLLGLIVAMTVVQVSMGCGKKSEAEEPSGPVLEYADQDLQGVVDTKPWRIQSGVARPSAMKPGQMRLSLSDEIETDPCNSLAFGSREVLTSVAQSAGESVLGAGDPMQTATFFIQTTSSSINLIATQGKITISSVTDQEVSGRAVIYMDDGNVVNGSFTIPFCPEVVD